MILGILMTFDANWNNIKVVDNGLIYNLVKFQDILT